MIIVKVFGGLGNQMFQYAFGQILKCKLETEVLYDTNDFKFYALRNFELLNFGFSFELANDDVCSKFRVSKWPSINYFVNKILTRRSYFYEPKIDLDRIHLQKENYFWGYWQFIDYYDSILESLREQFDLKSNLTEESSKVKNLIEELNSVSIHIRKSDYLLKKNSYFASCEMDYYQKAIEYIKYEIKNPTFFIFSDDFEWVESNMNFKGSQYIYVKTNSVNSTIEDFVLMKSCKHNIIANSTYSWWAAYLNSYADKIVICPEKWYNNSHKTLNRNEWIKVKNG